MTKLMVMCVFIEVIGIAVTAAGIGVELATHAGLGWAMLSVGSLILAIGGLIWGKFMRIAYIEEDYRVVIGRQLLWGMSGGSL